MLEKRLIFFQKIYIYFTFLFILFLITPSLSVYALNQQTSAIIEKIIICEDTNYETDAYIFSSQQDRPVIMILAGVHGDELAGVTAVRRFMEDFQPAKGKVIVIPKTNKAACQSEVRAITPEEDLNRKYPGDKKSEGVARLAGEIMGIMNDYKVDFLLDLHESVDFYQQSSDHYGQTIVLDIHDNELLNQMSSYLLKQLNQKVILPENCFNILLKPVEGSGTHEAWHQYKIPGITFETCTKIEFSKRVNWHYHCIQKTLSFFNMVNIIKAK
ncbi:MAG: succinylglutamate desuccinylase/aspartoacylase family protein [Atribacterota bacterium]|jgi:predicted deacylase|nr:succinylglutamate desuccinylase/aspartoacylase family protein [Atribacterota bacterium]MDD4895786.1 succinylglutamate desuccinylase/aspartoacylase family protein [Atribacterota bacterium]MDD5636366.1 succinylglutamate desuccinylase/aspartoacylase family protein [Atribacterota bacterium]